MLLVLLFLILCLPIASAQKGTAVTKKSAAALTPAERKAAAQLKLETIREVTTALASKEMEGRGTAQPGADRAAKYIADRFGRMGLKPGGDSSTYLQSIKFKIENMLPESSLKVGETVFTYKKDFAFYPPFPAESKDVSGGLVFVGYGVVSDELKRNDLAGIDVAGKIVILLSGKPKNVDAAAWAKASNEEAVYGRLILKGAAGFLVNVQEEDGEALPFTVYPASHRLVSLAETPPLPYKVPPVVVISDPAGEKIFSAQGTTLAQIKQKAEAGEFVSRDLKLQASLSSHMKREEGTSSNVIGWIEGSDAKLKSEALVYTAHYDAFGIDYERKIYSGASDNALGVGKLIAMAEVFAAMNPRPRRSIIFIASTAEEYSMIGVEHWLKHPTWPLEKVAADINYDGIGTEVWGKFGFILDLGFDHSDLGKVIKEVAAAFSIKIIPDQWTEVGIFYQADHYPFVKKGIPALYLLGGPAGNLKAVVERAETWMLTNYHQPGDTVQPNWKWDGARTLAALGLITGMRIANKEAMPAWKADSPYNRPRGTDLPAPEE